MDKKWYFLFQIVFFSFSTFILHLALFNFLGDYREGIYPDWNSLKENFLYWLPVIMFDLFVGIFLGIINALFSVTLVKDLKNIRKLVISTDIIWLLFCLFWYFNNRGVINVEAVGHVLSPFLVGFAGGILIIINLTAAVMLNKTTAETS